MANSQFLSTCSADAIHKAAEKLKSGHLVAFPTETVYGLGADATNEEAVKRIYEVKGRPNNHPLIVHVASINALETWAQDIPEYAIELARAFWPGPMTLILKRRNVAKDFITSSQDSVGIRVPSDPVALELLSQFESLGGLGVAAPSANRFGQISPTSAHDVQAELGEYLSSNDLILEGGQSEVGIESTIIDCRNMTPTILRPGAVTKSIINSIVLVEFANMAESQLRASGNLEKHYAPKAKVILNKTPKSGQAYIAFSSFQTPKGVFRISSPKDVHEFAQNLYAGMRRADELGFNELIIEVPEGQGIEIALLDRLNKASRGR
jgi:L-threonylcarbamoyladenylate synthase